MKFELDDSEKYNRSVWKTAYLTLNTDLTHLHKIKLLNSKFI